MRAVHADLGDVDWPHTVELAARHAARYDVPFTVVSRRQDDLLGMVEQRGMWPSSNARYCTSALKRTPVRTLMTELVARERQRGGVRDPVRVLHVMGMRAEESRSRARRPAFSHDAARPTAAVTSTSGCRFTTGRSRTSAIYTSASSSSCTTPTDSG